MVTTFRLTNFITVMSSTTISATVSVIKIDNISSLSLGFSKCLSLDLKNQAVLENVTPSSNK